MKDETRTFYEAAVVRAVAHVARSLDRALDLEALSREAALSPFHFHRVFRGLVGETPLELHRRLRLERAARQLCAAEPGVTEIAFTAGYDTHEAFTRTFRHRYGVAPSVFRRNAARPGCHPPSTTLAAACGVHLRDGRVDLRGLTLTRAGDATMDVVIETCPARRLATVRHVGPYPNISEAFHRLGQRAAAGGLYEHVEPAMIALYHDDPETTPAAELRSDAALVVRGDVPLPDGVTEATLPAGRYAKTLHRGSYTGLGDTWARLMGHWLPSSGERVGDGPSYEVYVNDPRTAATDDLLTAIYVSLAG